MFRATSLSVLAFLLTTATFAQTSAPQQAPSQQSGLTCADFVRSPNGMWSPIRPVQIGGVTMGPGVSFGQGVTMGGVNLAAELEKQCPH